MREEQGKLPQSYGIKQLNMIKVKEFILPKAWRELFGKPEKGDTWFVWGNSGNGKSTFCAMLAHVFSSMVDTKVLYVALEEKNGKSIRRKLKDVGFTARNKNFQLLTRSTYQELIRRLHRRYSEDVIFIDSLQYWGITYKQYQELRRVFPDKTFVMVSHAQGKNPKGSVADGIHYDAGVKIWVEGGRIIVKHRYEGGGGQMVVIPELSDRYWNDGEKISDATLVGIAYEFIKQNKLLPYFIPHVEKLGYNIEQFKRKKE